MIANAQIDIRGNPTRRVIDLSRPAVAGVASFTGPWELTISGESATCNNCCYLRGPIFKWLGTISGTITGSSTESWIGARIDVDTGSAELTSGATIADVSDSSIPSTGYVKLPLYRLAKTVGVWRVSVDLRSIGLMLYV